MLEDNRFVVAVEAIYSAALTPANWPTALLHVAQVFDDAGAVLTFGQGGVRSEVRSLGYSYAPDATTGPKGDRSSARRIERREHDSSCGSVSARRPDSVNRAVPFATGNSISYSELRAPCDVSSPVNATYATRLLLARAPHRPAYSDAEIELYRELCRHAEKALGLSLHQGSAAAESAALQQAIGRLGIGVCALDSLKRIVLANRAAAQLLGHDLTAEGQRLDSTAAFNGEIERVVDALLAGATEQDLRPSRPVLIRRDNGRRPIVAYFLQIGKDWNAPHAFLTDARILMLLIDSDATPPPNPAMVRDILGVTLGEARVAALVGSGASPRQAAGQLGISEQTARTVLKRVFAKAGISRQSELAAVLSRLAIR